MALFSMCDPTGCEGVGEREFPVEESSERSER